MAVIYEKSPLSLVPHLYLDASFLTTRSHFVILARRRRPPNRFFIFPRTARTALTLQKFLAYLQVSAALSLLNCSDCSFIITHIAVSPELVAFIDPAEENVKVLV